MNKKVELLAPAGNMERLKTAIHFGADAVYIGATEFSLRNLADNFTLDEIAEAVSYAHERNVKIYVTVNAFMRDEQLTSLPETLKALEKANVDALIINDPSVIRVAKRVAPSLSLHLSTQANTLNSEAAMFWHEQGIDRIVLARELTLSEIRNMREKLPETLELEAFVHGAMCVSYSGRCLFSNYIAGRDSNKGECAQPCRWSFEVRERGSDGEFFPIISQRNGSFILNSKDMCMVDYLDDIIDSGIVSLKIEGRMKSILYVATVVNAYRMALDGYDMDAVRRELMQLSHRPYTTGFMLGEYGDCFGSEMIQAETGGYIQQYQISAVVLGYDAENKIAHIEQRNRFAVGDELIILSPKDVGRKFNVSFIRSEEGESQDCAPHACQHIYIGCDEPVKAGDILKKQTGKQ